jgi:hypothetical protein
MAVAALSFTEVTLANLLQGRKPLLPGLTSGLGAKPAFPARGAQRARPAAPATKPSATGAATRAASAVHVAGSTADGQTGYVHFFQLILPDGTPEIQVGLELPDNRIAWSFPGLGVTISPFIEDGVVTAAGKSYEVWHLYGIRPFPDEAAMSALRRELRGRIDPWVKAATPYCGVDALGGGCMSCLGFVLRVLHPGRTSNYPDLPPGFWRSSSLGRYSTNDLLLYLTGMLELPSREARLRRIGQLGLPEELREDLEELVYSIGVTESADATNPGAAQKRPVARSPRATAPRPGQRRRL